MDHSAAPILDALAGYREAGRYGFTPPGHRQGRGADPRTRMAISEDAFRSDVLSTAGLDDRKASGEYLSKAEATLSVADTVVTVSLTTVELTPEDGGTRLTLTDREPSPTVTSSRIGGSRE